MIRNFITSAIAIWFLSSSQSFLLAEENYKDLGKSLVDSLTRGDLVEYSACWVTKRALSAELTKKEAWTKEQEQVIDSEMAKRNSNIIYSFEVIQKALKEYEIDQKSLTLTAILARVDPEESEHFKTVPGFDIQVKSNKGDMVITIDDGIYIDKKWYFSDSPTNLEYSGKFKLLKDRPKSP
jgi:hypothetical protein